MRRRYSDQQIKDAVQASISIAQVLKILGLSPTGCNYKAIQAHFHRLQLDLSHFAGQGHLRGRRHQWTKKMPLGDILVIGSPYTNLSYLKLRLIREGLLVNCCALCDGAPLWQGQPLVLVLDHKNGDRTDHRLANLRLLCPNCNSQQHTFAGRNKGRYAVTGASPAR